VTLLSRLIAAIVLVAGTSGCTLFHSRSQVTPLDMPQPPPRIVPIESQPIVAAPAVDVPNRAPEPIEPTQPPPPPARVERGGESQTPARTEPPAEAPAAAAPNPAPTPPPALQTTANPSEAEQRTRVTLENAKRDLNKIDLKRLNADARSQYDIARRMVQQAEEALKGRNPVFAEQLADKAAQIAALLQKR
jgi:hypothetical protein